MSYTQGQDVEVKTEFEWIPAKYGAPSASADGAWCHHNTDGGVRCGWFSLDNIRPATAKPATRPAKPEYYQHLQEAGHEPWAVLNASLPKAWMMGYHVATAMAYLQRCCLKHDKPDDDIRKASAHLAECVRVMETTTP